MPEQSSEQSKSRMIHIRLDNKTHRDLKIHAARAGTSIQQMVERLIQRAITSRKNRP